MIAAAPDQSIVWSDDFLIGIEEVDYEHQGLVEDICRFRFQSRHLIWQS